MTCNDIITNFGQILGFNEYQRDNTYADSLLEPAIYKDDLETCRRYKDDGLWGML